MVEEGDRIIFPDVGKVEDPHTGNEVVDTVTETDTVVDVEPRDETGFGIISDEGELGFDLAERGRTAISDLGGKVQDGTVEPSDIAIEPAGRSTRSEIDVREIHNDRSQEAQIADESKDAELTTNKEKWASDPSSYDYPGVDTGPTFDDAFDSDFETF